MAQFRTKDLMVSVIPEEIARACLLRTFACIYPTLHCHHYRSCHRLISCHYVSGGCGYHLSCYKWHSCQLAISHCHRYLSPCGYLSPCQHHLSPCPYISRDPCGIHSPVVFDPDDLVIDPVVVRDIDDIRELRKELEQTLERLGQLEEEGIPEPAETTADELEQLEARMKEALEEIRSELKKKRG